jgi:hypothetical protein
MECSGNARDPTIAPNQPLELWLVVTKMFVVRFGRIARLISGGARDERVQIPPVEWSLEIRVIY